jgi:hypothetical protein
MDIEKIIADKELVAYCGLYCGVCKKYRQGKCPGCAKNNKATWCQIRNCCIDNIYSSCADCKKVSSTTGCKKFNNFVGKIFSVIFNSNRPACVKRIKEIGYDAYAKEMAEKRVMTIKR